MLKHPARQGLRYIKVDGKPIKTIRQFPLTNIFHCCIFPAYKVDGKVMLP